MAFTSVSRPESWEIILAEDGNIKSSMCLLKGPGGPIPNRPEKFGKLEENLKCDGEAKTALQHLVVQSSQNNNQCAKLPVHVWFLLVFVCILRAYILHHYQIQIGFKC